MNKINVTQNLLYIVPLINHTIVVRVDSINPMAIGCFVLTLILLLFLLI